MPSGFVRWGTMFGPWKTRHLGLRSIMGSQVPDYSQSMRIIVTGLVGLYPIGGVVWDYLQYVIGLARLGHDVYYHEDTWSWPYLPTAKTYVADATFSANYLRDFFARYAPDLQGRWHYLHLHETSFGMERARFDEVARTRTSFSMSAARHSFPSSFRPDAREGFLDTDPGYNQIVLTSGSPGRKMSSAGAPQSQRTTGTLPMPRIFMVPTA